MSRPAKTLPFYQHNWFVAVATLCVLGALLYPLFVFQYTQNIDLINHMARQFVRSAPAVSPVHNFFEFKWLLIPYLAVEIFTAPLMPFFSVHIVSRMLLGAIIVLWTVGPVVLYRAIWGRWSVWPLIPSLVVYNLSFGWGFAAFLLASGCMMFVFAAWVWTDVKGADKSWKRTAVFSALSFGIYCLHLYAFACFGLMLIMYELSKLADGKVTAKALLARVLQLAPLALPGMLHFGYHLLNYPPQLSTATITIGLADREAALFSPFIFGIRTVDGASHHILNWASMVLVGGTIAYFAIKDLLVINRHMALVLIALGTLAIIMPPQLFGVAFTHYRLPFIVIAILFASLRAPDIPVAGKNPAYIMLTAAFIVTLHLSVTKLMTQWDIYQEQVREFIAKTETVKRGSKVLLVNRDYPKAFVEHYHTGSYLVTEREAFIPSLFTVGYIFNPVAAYKRLTPPDAAHPMAADDLRKALDGKLPAKDEQGRPSDYLRTWWKDYDYVIAYQTPGKPALYPQFLTQIAKGSFFIVYKIKDTAKGYKAPQKLAMKKKGG